MFAGLGRVSAVPAVACSALFWLVLVGGMLLFPSGVGAPAGLPADTGPANSASAPADQGASRAERSSEAPAGSTVPPPAASADPAPSIQVQPQLVPETPAVPQQPQQPAAVAVAVDDAGMEAQVLALVNSQRSAAGCGLLAADGALDALARAHSADMRDRGFFSHTNPSGESASDRASAAGIDNFGGENIAYGHPSAQAVMQAWMESPSHRANILNCDVRTLGVGVASGGSGPYWTQEFGR